MAGDMTAAEVIELEILSWLGLLPDSEPQNSEPDYEARLRRLGEGMHKKGVDPQDLLLGLALHYLTIESRKAYWLGRAKQLIQLARVVAWSEDDAMEAGRRLMAQHPEGEH